MLEKFDFYTFSMTNGSRIAFMKLKLYFPFEVDAANKKIATVQFDICPFRLRISNAHFETKNLRSLTKFITRDTEK